MKPEKIKVVKDIVYMTLSVMVIVYMSYISDPKIIPINSMKYFIVGTIAALALGVLIFNLMKFTEDWNDNSKSKSKKNENK